MASLEMIPAALYHEQADLIEGTVYLLDKDTDKYVPNRIKQGKMTLVKNNKDIMEVSFDKRFGTADGSIRGFFSHPPSVVNVQVKFSIVVSKTVDFEATIPVVYEPAEETPLHEQPNL